MTAETSFKEISEKSGLPRNIHHCQKQIELQGSEINALNVKLEKAEAERDKLSVAKPN